MIPDRVWDAEAAATGLDSDLRWGGDRLGDLTVEEWAEVWRYVTGPGLLRVRPSTLLGVWQEARLRSRGAFGCDR